MTLGPQTAMLKDDAFVTNLGLFYGMWSTVETTVDYLIGRYLNLPHEETHILTAGMEFGRKANLLRTLVMRSRDPNKEKIRDLLSRIQSESKRNLFSHSMINSNVDSVTFVYRKTDGIYSAKETRFAAEQFAEHVRSIARLGSEFSNVVKIDDVDFQSFGQAALSASQSDTTSPQPPSSKISIAPAAPSVPYPPRFRALALFGRRPPERVVGIVGAGVRKPAQEPPPALQKRLGGTFVSRPDTQPRPR
jgi:hypothetical protein